MLQRVEDLARLSVGRGCGFASIAILTCFVGLSSDIGLALRTVGVLGLIVSVVLLIRARRATGRPYQHTELWIMLKPQERPQRAIAQQVIGNVLRETYLYFAMQAAVFSAATLTSALVLF